MKIAIVTTGRFHVCDLARELSERGHEVAFYSLVPPTRTRQFGLPDSCNRWLLPRVLPEYVAVRTLARTRLKLRAEERFHERFGRVAAAALERCDVLIGMSGIAGEAAETARSKYGARVFIERGSRHILSQREILDAALGASGGSRVPEFAVRRELHDYEVAHAIVVPARHVVTSFTERGVPETRLLRNPYGVDLRMFPPTPKPEGEPTILMVGAWSLQKGCDILVDAWRKMPGTKLVHVGAAGDAAFPHETAFTHHDPVDQPRLGAFYARSDVLGLASRQEGLALVQAQALASGLHVACTDRTGGEDLAELTGLDDVVSVAPSGDAEAFSRALRIALDRSRHGAPERDLLRDRRERLSWAAYGRRYDGILRAVA